MAVNTMCDDGCVIELDVDQVAEVYTRLSGLVYTDLDKQYQESKINGATYADVFSKLMSQVIGSALTAVSQLQMNETPMDRCLKTEQCTSSEASTIREDKLAAEQITSSEKKTVNDTNLSIAEIGYKGIAGHSISIQDFLKIEKDYGYLAITDEHGNIYIGPDIQNGKIDGEISVLNEQGLDLIAAQGLKTAQSKKVDYETKDILPEQKALITRQIEGFDDNLAQKLFDAQMNSWALMFSSGLIDTTGENGGMPEIIDDDAVSILYNNMNPYGPTVPLVS